MGGIVNNMEVELRKRKTAGGERLSVRLRWSLKVLRFERKRVRKLREQEVVVVANCTDMLQSKWEFEKIRLGAALRVEAFSMTGQARQDALAALRLEESGWEEEEESNLEEDEMDRVDKVLLRVAEMADWRLEENYFAVTHILTKADLPCDARGNPCPQNLKLTLEDSEAYRRELNYNHRSMTGLRAQLREKLGPLEEGCAPPCLQP